MATRHNIGNLYRALSSLLAHSTDHSAPVFRDELGRFLAASNPDGLSWAEYLAVFKFVRKDLDCEHGRILALGLPGPDIVLFDAHCVNLAARGCDFLALVSLEILDGGAYALSARLTRCPRDLKWTCQMLDVDANHPYLQLIGRWTRAIEDDLNTL